jgi:hypothetical protein
MQRISIALVCRDHVRKNNRDENFGSYHVVTQNMFCVGTEPWEPKLDLRLRPNSFTILSASKY